MVWPALYGLLAVVAAAAARRSPLNGLGYALVAVWAITNTEVYFGVPLPIRALVYTWLMVGMTFGAAWTLVRYPAASAVVMTLSLVAGMVTFAYTRVGTEHADVRHLWNIGTNILYALSCLAVIITRIADVADSRSGEPDWSVDDGRFAHGHTGARLASEE